MTRGRGGVAPRAVQPGSVLLGPTFLRRPRGAEWVADVLRVLTVVSVPVAAVGWGGVSFAVMLLVLLGAVVPRMLGLRPAFDTGVVALSLVAGWSSVLEWYTTVFLWDKVVHVLLGGLVAALIVVIGADVGVLRRLADVSGVAQRAAVVVVTTFAGLGIGGVWEMLEWVGHTYLDSSIFVGYGDTIGDLAADGAGALVLGFLLPWLARDRRAVLRD